MLFSMVVSTIRISDGSARSSSIPKCLGIRVKFGHRVVSSKLVQVNHDDEYFINDMLSMVVGSIDPADSPLTSTSMGGISYSKDASLKASSKSNQHELLLEIFGEADINTPTRESKCLFERSISLTELASTQNATYLDFKRVSSYKSSCSSLSVALDLCKCESISNNKQSDPTSGSGNQMINIINETIMESADFFKSLYAEAPKLKEKDMDSYSAEIKEGSDGLILMSKLRRREALSAAEKSGSKLAAAVIAAVQCADGFKTQNQTLMEESRRHYSSIAMTFSIQKELDALNIRYDMISKQLDQNQLKYDENKDSKSYQAEIQTLKSQVTSKDKLLDALKAEVDELRKSRPDSSQQSKSMFSSSNTKELSLKAEVVDLKASLEKCQKEKSELEDSVQRTGERCAILESLNTLSEDSIIKLQDVINQECCSKDELAEIVSEREKFAIQADVSWKFVMCLISLSHDRDELSSKINFLQKAVMEGDFSRSKTDLSNLEIEYQSLKAYNSNLQQKLQEVSESTRLLTEYKQKLKKAEVYTKYQQDQMAVLNQELQRLHAANDDPSLNELRVFTIDRSDNISSLSAKLKRANDIIVDFDGKWKQAEIFSQFQEDQVNLLKDELSNANRNKYTSKGSNESNGGGQTTSAESAAAIRELTTQLEQAQALINGYQDKIKEAYGRIDGLERKLDKTLDDKNKYQDLLTNAQKELEQLQSGDSSKAGDLTILRDKLDNMSSLLQNIQKENKEKDEKINSYTTKLKEKEETLKQGADYVNQLHDKAQADEVELERLRTQEETNLNSLKELQSELSSATVAKAQLDNNIKLLKQENESYKMQIKSFLNNDINSADKRHNMLTETQNANEKLKSENQQQSLTIATLKSQLEEMRSTFSLEKGNWQTKLNEAYSENKSLTSSIQNLKNASQSNEASLNSELDQLKIKVEEVVAENNSLKSSQGARSSYGYEDNLGAGNDGEHNIDVVSTKKYEEVMEQLIEAKMQIAVTTSELEDKIQRYKSEIKRLRVDISKLEAMSVANSSSGDMLNEIIGKNEQLMSQLESAENEILDNHTKMEEAKEFFRHQKTVVTSLQQEVASLKAGGASSSAIDAPPPSYLPPPPPPSGAPSGSSVSESEYANLVADLTEANEKISQYEAQLAYGAEFVEGLNQDLDRLESEKASMEEDNASLKSQIKSISTNDTNSMSSQISTLRSQLQSKDTEIRALQKHCSDLDAEARSLREQLQASGGGSGGDAKYDEVLAQLNQKKMELNQKEAVFENEKRDFNTKIKLLQESNKTFETSYNTLQRQYLDLQNKSGGGLSGFFGKK